MKTHEDPTDLRNGVREKGDRERGEDEQSICPFK